MTACRAVAITGRAAAHRRSGQPFDIVTEPATRVPAALERLVDHNLLGSASPGHYRVHGLLHSYARELATASEPAPVLLAKPRRPAEPATRGEPRAVTGSHRRP